MGSKGSKGKKGSAPSGGGSLASPGKIALPSKKIKKEYPQDLTSFIYLGGIVIEEYIEIQREASFQKPKGPEPPKPLDEMTPQERSEWDKELERHEKKLAMQALMEKNLQQKIKHGDKPIAPPVQGGMLGKAKKKMQQTQEKLTAKAEEITKPTESVEDRVKRQAMAGAGGTLTGGATAALGQDIANSQAIRDLEKKRKEFAKQEEAKKQQEEAERRKQEAEKKKNQPKGLADFLNKTEIQEAKATSPTSSNRKSVGPAARLNAFLSSAETPQAAYMVTSETPPKSSEESASPSGNKLAAFISSAATNSDEPVTNIAPSEAPSPAPNKLASFLSTPATPSEVTTNERPKSERKLSSFLGATMKRLSVKKTETDTQPSAVEVPADANVAATEEPIVEPEANEPVIPKVEEIEKLPAYEQISTTSTNDESTNDGTEKAAATQAESADAAPKVSEVTADAADGGGPGAQAEQ